MWEMLYLSKVFQQFPQRIRTGHVCEGPGGFIQGIYDAAERAKKQVIATTAMTLRPDHPSVPGWKRASQFLRRNKTVKIEYGPKNDGNILDPVNQDAFVAACGQGVHIFTADGGFDFSDEYDKQELNIYTLLVNSILLAVQTLLADGMMVLKIFDVQSRATEDLLTFLASQFKRWTLYKPATSRPCNSEKYFIGINFRGKNQLLIDFLKSLAKDLQENKVPTALLTEPLGETVAKIREQIHKIQQPILDSQKKSIRAVLEISKMKTFEQQREDSFREIQNAVEWCSVFHIPTRQNPMTAFA
jgi:23S rRNA U2552 (ribose-2'-O)-methylase RlmE/FtsJ